MPVSLKIPRDQIAEFCLRNHIRRLDVFGSALRDDFTAESDVDLLVEFDSGHIPGFIKLAGMEIELSSILGHKVDMRTPEDLSPYSEAGSGGICGDSVCAGMIR